MFDSPARFEQEMRQCLLAFQHVPKPHDGKWRMNRWWSRLLGQAHVGRVGGDLRPLGNLSYCGFAYHYAVPWSEDDGDPARPQRVLGVPVAEHLRTRRDQPGALVALEDGRFAVTGLVVAVGAPPQVQAYCRRRIDRTADQTEQAWWQEVVGALAAEGGGTRGPGSS
jgi:hypothetical protein